MTARRSRWATGTTASPHTSPVAERRKRAARKLAQLRKKGHDPRAHRDRRARHRDHVLGQGLVRATSSPTPTREPPAPRPDLRQERFGHRPPGRRRARCVRWSPAANSTRSLVRIEPLARGALEGGAPEGVCGPDRHRGRAPRRARSPPRSWRCSATGRRGSSRPRARSRCPARARMAPGSASTSRRCSTAWAHDSTTHPSCSSRCAGWTGPSSIADAGRAKGLAKANRAGAAIDDEHLAAIFGIEMEAKASRPVRKPRKAIRKKAGKARRALRRSS